jgi:hypothetical protein
VPAAAAAASEKAQSREAWKRPVCCDPADETCALPIRRALRSPVRT